MVSSQIYCSACGVANPINAAFCFACGRPLHGASTPSAASAASTGQMHSSGSLQGTFLQDRYSILGRLGSGGFGAVYRAFDTKLGNRVVAVKEMSQAGLSPQEIIEATDAFKHEALLLANLMHPSLPRIYDHFSEAGHWYLVMDFIEGETLERRLYSTIGRRLLNVEDVLTIGISLAGVLNYLHTRTPPIIFRDLKPANIMLTPDGNLYLIDFGIARLFKPGQIKDTIAFGSPGYAAPEQYGKAQTNARADMYGLGATLHQLLTGDDPAENPFSFAVLHSQVPALDALIMKMVNMDPRNRPASMMDVKQELQQIATQVHVGADLSRPQADISRPLPIFGPNAWQPQGQEMPSPINYAPTSAPSQEQRVTPGPGPLSFSTQGMLVAKYSNHIDKIRAVAWSPDGTRIASASNDGTVQVWEANTGTRILTYIGHTDWVNALSWSPDGQYLASASNDRTVQVWNASTGDRLFVYAGHAGWLGGGVHTVAWSPDGQCIVSAGHDKTAQIWNVENGEKTVAYRGHSGVIWSLAWSPDSSRVVSGGLPTKTSDAPIHIWDVHSSHTLLTYRGHGGGVLAAAWSPDGTHIVSASSDSHVHVWNAQTGNTAVQYTAHAGTVWSVAWSPDSTRIASGGADATVKLWDALSANTLFTYRGHSGTAWSVIPEVHTVAWSPDGQFIASGGSDNTVVQVWRAE